MDNEEKNERDEFFGGQEPEQKPEKWPEERPEEKPQEKPEASVYERRGKMFSQDVPPKKKKKANGWKIAASCLGALAVAGMGFLGGYYAYAGRLDEQMKSLIWAKERIQSEYYQEITDEAFYDAVFGGVNELLDPYSQYLTADEYADMMEEATGKWSGLGITFSTRDADGNERLLITRVAGNSPAEAAGILAGDCVVGFGASEAELTESVSFEEFSAFLEERAAGEKFALKLRRGKEADPFVTETAKEDFVENYVFYRSRASAYLFTGENAAALTESGNVLSALDEDTAYIRLIQFNGQAAGEFAAVMDIFKKEGRKNLILDLRSNGGGYMHILEAIASYFCKSATEKNPVIAIGDYPGGKREYFKATGNRYHEYFGPDSRVSVLADNGTASASECLIGAMLDYGAIDYADIYLSERGGEAKTFGKGIMQRTFASSLFGRPDAIKLTTARILWPVTENCIHDRGVLPADGAHVVAENYVGDAEILEAWASISAR